MVITYNGGQSFKVSFGDTTLAFDPISKDSKLNAVKFGADVALISLNHPDFNGVDNVAFGNKDPFVVKAPGEYELGTVTVRGFGIKTQYENEEKYNTIYQVRMEEMNLLFLGALGATDIDPKILSDLGDIDILFLPIGGGDVLEVPDAAKLAVKLEAKVVLPMNYSKEALEAFLKEMDVKGSDKLDKLTIKRKDLATMSGEVVVLSY